LKSAETRAELRAELIEYYRRRAGEYEAFYAKPERQADLLLLKKKIAEMLQNARVLEVACGTGYWTTVIANAASSVTATDLAQEPMNIARSKDYPKKNTTFIEADAYALPESLGRFDAAFAGFWWSHVPRERLGEFIASLHARLEPGATVLLLDNLYVEGNSTAVTEIDTAGNTYQLRTLSDGSRFRVMKNYPTQDELRALLPAPVHYQALQYHWLAQYRV
jgi:demethylmenaquinone methyltransferase/2-methoxy-6-polyprenyl-1,4-benzoquinol methylase